MQLYTIITITVLNQTYYIKLHLTKDGMIVRIIIPYQDMTFVSFLS